MEYSALYYSCLLSLRFANPDNKTSSGYWKHDSGKMSGPRLNTPEDQSSLHKDIYILLSPNIIENISLFAERIKLRSAHKYQQEMLHFYIKKLHTHKRILYTKITVKILAQSWFLVTAARRGGGLGKWCWLLSVHVNGKQSSRYYNVL